MSTGRHTLTHAKNVFQGDAYYALYQGGQRGIEFQPIVKHNFGVPAAADSNGLVSKQVIATAAATVTLASSVTGASKTAGTFPVTLDVPRNVTITTSDLDGSPTTIFKGTDTYGATMWERMTLVSDTTVSGKKAFKTIDSISHGTAASGTWYIGFGDRLGLPFKLENVYDVVQIQQGVLAASDLLDEFYASHWVLPTYTVTETHSATVAVTGYAGLPRDIRGTWKPSNPPDTAQNFSMWFKVADVDSKFGAFGLDQAAS
jgi:hypothetical protein